MLVPMKITAAPPMKLPLRATRPSQPGDPVDAWVQQQSQFVPSHQNLVVDLGNGTSYTVQGKQVGTAQKTLDHVAEFITAATQEVQAAIIAGPNLALLGVSEVVKPLVLNGVPPGVTSQVEQWYQPGIQVASVGLSLVNFARRYKEAQGKRTTGMEKAVLIANGAHIATSTIGLAGIAAAALLPSLQPYSSAAWGIALAGNVMAFGMNWLDYFQERGSHNAPLVGKE